MIPIGTRVTWTEPRRRGKHSSLSRYWGRIMDYRGEIALIRCNRPNNKRVWEVPMAELEPVNINNDLVSVSEIATILGVAGTSVRFLLKTGRLEGKRLNRDWVVFRASVEDYKINRRGGRVRPVKKPVD